MGGGVSEYQEKTKRQKIKEVIYDFGFLFVLLGFILGVIFMVWFVPRTTMINTIKSTQECVTVTVYNQPQDFCKEVKEQ